MRIMFVCTGNICRSPLAEAVFRVLLDREGLGEHFEVASSGTTAYHVGQPADERMRRTALSHGVDVEHRSRQLGEADFDYYDLLLAMDLENLSDMRLFVRNGRRPDKVRLFREFDPRGGKRAEVPDPYYGGQSGFERVYEIVERTCRSLLAVLLEQVPAGDE